MRKSSSTGRAASWTARRQDSERDTRPRRQASDTERRRVVAEQRVVRVERVGRDGTQLVARDAPLAHGEAVHAALALEPLELVNERGGPATLDALAARLGGADRDALLWALEDARARGWTRGGEGVDCGPDGLCATSAPPVYHLTDGARAAGAGRPG